MRRGCGEHEGLGSTSLSCLGGDAGAGAGVGAGGGVGAGAASCFAFFLKT